MPTDIEWEDGTANINIMCDGCDREYTIMTEDVSGLESCPFCGHYLEAVENGEDDEVDSEADSWY